MAMKENVRKIIAGIGLNVEKYETVSTVRLKNIKSTEWIISF